MFCKRCGAQLEALDVFCPDCGAAIINNSENTVAAPRDGATTRLVFHDEPTVMANEEPTVMDDYGPTVMADNSATEFAYDLDKTVAAPGLYRSAGAENAAPPQPQQNQYADFQPNYPEPPALTAPAPAAKKSPLPIIIAAFAVVVAVAVAAFIFKEDIIGIFEKETTSANEAEESIYNEEETGGYVFDSPIVTDPYIEATYAYQEIPSFTQPAITNPPITDAPTHAPVTQAPTRPQYQPDPISGLNSSDPSAVADFYETALRKTTSVEAQRSFSLNSMSSGNGDMDLIVQTAKILVEELLAEYSTTVYSLPGAGAGTLKASDISSCSAYSSGGYTTVYIYLKSQTDGAEADPDTAGPVSRGIGTLGSIDRIAALLGAEIYSGKSSVNLTYSDAYIECVIDESTGRIVSGEWHYTADVYIGNVSGTVMGYDAALSDINASVDYTVKY